MTVIPNCPCFYREILRVWCCLWPHQGRSTCAKLPGFWLVSLYLPCGSHDHCSFWMTLIGQWWSYDQNKLPWQYSTELSSSGGILWGKNMIILVYGCFSFCLLICRSNILFNRTNIFRDKTSFRQFLTWFLPGLKKMLILIISNTEGVKVLVCPAIFFFFFFFWTLMGVGNNYQCWYMADVIAIFCG